MLEKAQDTLGKQNLGTVGLEAAKVQLSELVSKVSTKCLSSALCGTKDVSGFGLQQQLSNQPADCSLDSCLTSLGGPQRDEDRWCKDMKENTRKFVSPIVNDSIKAFDDEQVHASDFSMSVGVRGGNSSSSYTKRTDTIKPEDDHDDNIHEFQLSCFAPKLDLNIHEENHGASRSKQFDLNGFTWC